MTVQAYVKDPNAIDDYPIDWAAWLDDNDVMDDVIVASTWTAPVGIVVDAHSATTTATKVRLSGGTVGVEYLIVNHVVTLQGRQEDKTLIILVLET